TGVSPAGQSHSSNGVSLGATNLSRATSPGTPVSGPQDLGIAHAGRSGTAVTSNYTNNACATTTLKSVALAGAPAAAFVLGSNPGHGSILGASGNYTYAPLANYSGSDSFTYRTTDSHNLASAAATATVTVNPVNDRPVAQNGTATTSEDAVPLSVDLRPLVSD